MDYVTYCGLTSKYSKTFLIITNHCYETVKKRMQCFVSVTDFLVIDGQKVEETLFYTRNISKCFMFFLFTL